MSAEGGKGRGRGGKKKTDVEDEMQEDETENQASANGKASTKKAKHENLKSKMDDSNWYYAGDWWDETCFDEDGNLDEQAVWWKALEQLNPKTATAKKVKSPKKKVKSPEKVKSPKTRQAKATPKAKAEAKCKAKQAKQPAGQSANSPVKKSKKQNKQDGKNETKKRKQSPTKKAEPAAAAKDHKKQKKHMVVGKSVPEQVTLYTKRINKFLMPFVGSPNRKCDEEQKKLIRSQLWDLKGTDLSYNIYWSKTGAGLKCKSEGRDFAYRQVDNPKRGTWLLRMATVLKAAEQMVACMQYVQHKLVQQLENYYVVLFCCSQFFFDR